MRSALAATILVAGLLGPAASSAWSQPSTPAPATAADAAPFIGDWTLSMQGPNGPGTFNVSLKIENDKVVGEVSSDAVRRSRSEAPPRRTKR